MPDIQVGDQVTIVHKDMVLICRVVAIRPAGQTAQAAQAAEPPYTPAVVLQTLKRVPRQDTGG